MHARLRWSFSNEQADQSEASANIHTIFNNNYEDQSQRNAEWLEEILGTPTP